MPTQSDDLKDRLSRYQQISISVTGRKSGKVITIPIWFVYEDGTLFLLPVRGSNTQWYKNILQKPKMHIDARGTDAELKVTPITADADVKSVVEKFREKYGASNVKKYYSKFDVAVTAKVA